MQFLKNVLVYLFVVFNFTFCYCFYEGFIHKIVLVSRFSPFICIFTFYLSFLLKVFRFDTEILRDSCVVLLLKTLSRLPQGVAFLCFFTSACNIFRFAYLLQSFAEHQQKCCWIFLFPWIQLCFLVTLSKSMFFEIPGFILLTLYLICSVLGEDSLSCIPRIRFTCSFF